MVKGIPGSLRRFEKSRVFIEPGVVEEGQVARAFSLGDLVLDDRE